MDLSTVASGLLVAIGNVGAVGLLINRALNKLDSTEQATHENSLLLAKTAETQKATAETLVKVQESIEELYESRNVHEKELTAVNTLHDVKGCKTFYQGSK